MSIVISGIWRQHLDRNQAIQGLFTGQLLADDLRYLQSLSDTSYHHVESAVIGRGFHVYVMAPAGRDNDTGQWAEVYRIKVYKFQTLFRPDRLLHLRRV